MTRAAWLVPLGVAALVAIAWAHLSLRRHLTSMSARLVDVQEGMAPIHTRCALLEERLNVVDQDMASAQEQLATLSESLGTQARLLAQERLEIRSLGEQLVASREESSRLSSAIEASLTADAQEAEVLEARLVNLSDFASELGRRLESQLSGMPAGAILPWIPGETGLPTGWLLCDGSLGTPDLRGRFLRGVGRPEQAGLYFESARMQAAGLHTHATDRRRSVDSVPVTEPPTYWDRGQGLLLSDMGVAAHGQETKDAHGLHEHQDEHVPAHFTVVFIMKRLR